MIASQNSVIARTARRVAFALFVSSLFGAAAAQEQAPSGTAQMPAPSLAPEQIQQLEALQQKRTELMEVQQRLDQIQEETMKANPQLLEQQDAFADLVKEEMKSMGRKPDEEVAELRELQTKLQNEGLSDAERQQLWGEFQQKVGAFQEAQSRALQTPKVKQAKSELHDAVVAAMKERDPETEKLLAQMQNVREELRSMHQKAMQQQ